MTEMRAEPDGEGVVVAWLTHPVTCLALLVLLVNDHVLKAAWSNAVTGKLSDLAWLLIAPALLATLVVLVSRAARAQAPRAALLVGTSLGVTGVIFALVKVTATGAATGSAVLSAVAGPSVVLRDPTDLIALPVLWLGWRVARPSRPAASSGARRPGWRWMLLLPIAVLGTAATSVPPPQGVAQLVVIEDMLAVREGFAPRWHVSTDGTEWERLDARDASGELTRKFDEAGGTLTQVCAPAAPLECFRAGDGLGVDRSSDGGASWVADWSVPEDVVAELAERYRPRVDRIRTAGVAIWPTAEGFQVWAANGGDGLAVRHEDGTWERLGFVYHADPAPVVPLPGEPTTISYPVFRGLPYGVIAAAVVCLLASAGTRRRVDVARSESGTTLNFLGVVFAALAAAANGHEGAVAGQHAGSGVLFGEALVPFGVMILVLVGLGLVLAGAARLGRRSLVGPLLFTVVGVTLAGELPPPLLAIAVCVAVVAAAVMVARRPAAGEPQPPGGTA